MPRRRLIGIALTFVSGVLFATLPILFRIVTASGVNLVTALALRFTLASALIWIAVGATLGGRPLRHGNGEGQARRLAPTSHSQFVAFVLMGVLYIGQSFSYLSSSVRVPIATTSILLYTYPAVVTVLARVFLHEAFTRTKLISLALALTGTLLTLGAPQAANDWLGVAFGLAAAIIYSTYIIVGAKAQHGVSPQVSSAVITLSAGLLTGAFGVATGQLQLMLSGQAWLAVIALAALSAAVPILFFLMGVERIGASQASIISTSELVSTAIFGALFLAQPLALVQIAGGVLIVAAVVLLARVQASRADS